MKTIIICHILEPTVVHSLRRHGIKPFRLDTMCFADCMIIMYATSVGHNIDPALYAAALLFIRPMMGGGTCSFKY